LYFLHKGAVLTDNSLEWRNHAQLASLNISDDFQTFRLHDCGQLCKLQMSLWTASKVAIQTLQQVFDLGYDRQIRELFHSQIGTVAYTMYTMHMRRDSLLKDLGYTTSTTLQKKKIVIRR
jgi:hypothetical protein